MFKSCLCIAGGLIGIVVGIKLLFWVDRLNDSPPSLPTCKKLKDDDSEVQYSSDEETVIVKRTLTSRMGVYEKNETVNIPKLSHMKKQDLIDECVSKNIACIGTVRVLRERLRVARNEERA
jgi:hypothetical protein